MTDATTIHIALVGLSGAGKSTLGRELADRLEWPFHDLDQRVSRAAGLSISEIFAAEGEVGFRRREREALARLVDEPGPAVSALGGGVVLDAQNRARLGSDFRVIWLQVDPGEAARRLAYNSDRPLLSSSHPERDLERLLDERSTLYRDVADHVFRSEDRALPTEEAVRLHLELVRLALIPIP